MSAEVATLTRTWSVGRHRCTLTVGPARPDEMATSVIEWSPQPPRRLSSSQLRAYRRGRNAAMAELAAELGGAVVLVEV